MYSFNSEIVRGLPWCTLDFKYPHKKKVQRLRSGERDGHGMSLFLDIKRPANVSRMTFFETLAV